MAFELLACINSKYGDSVGSFLSTDEPVAAYYTGHEEATTGPRSELVKYESSTAFFGAGSLWVFDGARATDYVVVTRADLLSKASANMQIRFLNRTSGGTLANETTYALLSSYTLVGPRDQDLILPHAPASANQYGAAFSARESTDATVTWFISDCMFCKATDIGAPTKEGSPSWDILSPEQQKFETLTGYFPYFTDRRITLTWTALNDTQRQAFEDFVEVSECLAMPCFLYDANADLFKDKLVHVLLESYELTARDTADYWTLTTTWRRLKVYL